MYYTLKIINIIVKKTNNYLRELKDDSCLRARANEWYLTYSKEIYLYFTIRIYITLYIYNKIVNY
jgi:hypothetical protein